MGLVRRRRTSSATTLARLRELWNGHALPRLGRLQLRELTPQTIARFRAELEAAGVGREAIRKTMTMLQGVLQRAVEWGRVPTNAVKVTRKPPKPTGRRCRRSRRRVEAMRARLLEQGELRDATLLAVLAYAGLRPQEALALEWRHVRERTLLVERALSDGQLKGSRTAGSRAPSTLLAPLRDGPRGVAPRGGRAAGDRWSSRRMPARSGARRTGATGASASTSRSPRRSASTARGRTTCGTRSRRC